VQTLNQHLVELGQQRRRSRARFRGSFCVSSRRRARATRVICGSAHLTRARVLPIYVHLAGPMGVVRPTTFVRSEYDLVARRVVAPLTYGLLCHATSHCIAGRDHA
jgi:hypothetical protein